MKVLIHFIAKTVVVTKKTIVILNINMITFKVIATNSNSNSNSNSNDIIVIIMIVFMVANLIENDSTAVIVKPFTVMQVLINKKLKTFVNLLNFEFDQIIKLLLSFNQGWDLQYHSYHQLHFSRHLHHHYRQPNFSSMLQKVL